MAWLIAFAFATLLASCSKDDDSVARDLLASVPSNSSFVLLAEGQQLAEKAGDAKKTLDLAKKNSSEKSARIIDALSGVWTPTAVVVFADGSNFYLTTQVDDPKKLRQEVEKIYGSKMDETDGIAYNGGLAINADQVWVSLSESLSSNRIVDYTKLTETQSFASVDYCEKMLTEKGDLKFLGDITSIINSQTAGGFNNSVVTGMLTSMLFKGAVYAAGTADFRNGEVVSKIAILDSKFRIAEFLIPTGGIDPETVKGVAESAESIFAIALPKKTVDRIKELGSTLGGALPSDILSALSCVDGTVVMAQSGGNHDVKGIVTTDGTSSMGLTQMLSSLRFQTSTAGNQVIFTEGNGPVTGSLPTADAAGVFKGAIAAIALSNSNDSNTPFRTLYLTLRSHRKGISIESRVLFPDKKSNALAQIVAALARTPSKAAPAKTPSKAAPAMTPSKAAPAPRR